MKRASTGETSNTKKVRINENQAPAGSVQIEDPNFALSLRRSFKYLSDKTKIERPPGHICGTIKHIMRLPGKFSVTLAPLHVGQRDMLEVYLSKLHLENLDPLRVGDQVRLSLKGARFESHQKKHHIPVRLFFTEGYHILWPGNEVNTFIVPQILQPATSIHKNHAPAQPLAISKKEQRRRRSTSKERHENRQVQNAAPMDTPQRDSAAETTETSSAPPRPVLPPSDSILPSSHTQGGSKANANEMVKPPEKYTPLHLVESMKSKDVCTIGVVLRVDPAKVCKSGDWMRSLRIADYTNINSSGPPVIQGLSVNLFASRDKKFYLPDPEMGDVIILNQIRISPFNDTFNGVGFTNRFTWAIYSRERREMHHGTGESAPSQSHGHITSPFYNPLPSDKGYCERLMDWWIEIERQHQEDADRTRVGLISHGPKKRQHKLVSELALTPNTARTDEYFNCTVQVLYGCRQDSGVFTLWVTDYTENIHCYRRDETVWCPGALARYVFQIETWDDAAKVAPDMKEGDYYALENVRIRLNTAGFLEGKLVEDKICHLDEATSNLEHLKSLIQRRKAWELETGSAPETFIDQLFKDATLDKFFHGTVEILHAEYQEDTSSVVYCTDYTARSDFGGIPPGAPWAKGLDNRVVKIVLSGGQNAIAKAVKHGDFCRFTKMRFRKDRMEGYTIGCQGGNQSLMEKLNPKNRDNKLLQDLFRRKTSLATASLPSSTFQEILDLNTFPEKYRVLCQVVTYSPTKLDDSIAFDCSSCKRRLRTLEKMCHECLSDEHLDPLCDLFLTVEDKDMSRVLVSVSEKSSVLRGLDLSTFLDDDDVRTEFRERLRPLVGKLYSASGRPSPIEKGPTLSMELIAWQDGEDVAFSLIDVKVL